MVVASALMTAPVAPVAAGPPAEVQGEPGTEAYAPATVLGLDAEQTAVGARLTTALRRAFAARGLGGGEEANLSELRLALGCRTDTPECLAGGGQLLRSRRLIYGSLHKFESGRWALDLSVLEVEAVEIAAHETFKIQGADLAPARIDRLAQDLVDRLLSDEFRSTIPEFSAADASPPPPPPPQVEGGDSDSARDGKWEFGLQRPTPRWKWAGFGVSLGVGLVAVAGSIGTTVWIVAHDNNSFGFRPRLIEAANNSLRNPNPDNQVNPMTVDDICEYNVTNEDGSPLVADDTGIEGARNLGVANVCNLGEKVQTTNVVFNIVAGVGLLSTVVFTGLLLVHRKPRSPVARTWRRRDLRLGLGPTWGQGSALRLGGRF